MRHEPLDQRLLRYTIVYVAACVLAFGAFGLLHGLWQLKPAPITDAEYPQLLRDNDLYIVGGPNYAYPTPDYPACINGWCILRCPIEGQECY